MRDDGVVGDLELYHSAVVVDDIHAAVELYRTAAGLEFTEVKDLAITLTVDGELRDTEFFAVYSRGGPPYLELIQDRSGGVWGRSGLELRHLGFFVPDVAAAVLRFEAQNCTARVVFPGSPPRIVFVQTPGGTWIELLGPDARSSFARWQETSYQPPEH